MADESDGAAVESPPREDPDAVTSQDEEEDDDEGFTFAPATRLPGAGRVIGQVYPVFGRPRSPPPKEEAGTATVRVPLRQLLLTERGASSSPSSQEQPGDDDDADDDLDGVPAETYCLWSPGTSPASASTSPAQFPKSGSTGSVLRWRQRLQVGRSHSDGKEKFVFLHQDDAAGSSSSPEPPGGVHSWSHYGRGRGSRRSTFLPYKQDLVGLFANASALRRSYHPF